MDAIQRRFGVLRWPYGEGDPAALAELESRIARVGRARGLITYSDLVSVVLFDLANLKESPRYVDIHAWQELDRAIVGDFLGVVSVRSYDAGGFFASALAVTAYDGSPGEGFERAAQGRRPHRQAEQPESPRYLGREREQGIRLVCAPLV